jgi:hypothetical protein
MSAEPYLFYAALTAWALPAITLYMIGRRARRAWNAPKGFLPEAFLAAVCLLWPFVAVLGLAGAGLLALLVLLALTNSIELNPQR